LSEDFAAQFERIKAVIGTGEIPSGGEETIRVYFEYLSNW
jgi:hypothetical protein